VTEEVPCAVSEDNDAYTLRGVMKLQILLLNDDDRPASAITRYESLLRT
jgi:hypothetical protein